MWLSGRLHIEERLNEGPRLQRKHKDESEAKQTNVTPEKDVMASAHQTPVGYKFAPLVASQQGLSEPARARLLWVILSLVLPVTFGHNTACRSPALAFSAAVHFAMKYCAASCSAVLRHSPTSWAAVVHWSALMPKALRSSRKHPIHSFSWPPPQPAPPPILRISRTSAISYPPCAPQIPQTRSASSVKSPRCSHFPSG